MNKQKIDELRKEARKLSLHLGYKNQLEQFLVYVSENLTQVEEEAKRDDREKIRQKLREIDLIDYYCKCNDQGHVIAMTRTAYDEFLQTLDSKEA